MCTYSVDSNNYPSSFKMCQRLSGAAEWTTHTIFWTTSNLNGIMCHEQHKSVSFCMFCCVVLNQTDMVSWWDALRMGLICPTELLCNRINQQSKIKNNLQTTSYTLRQSMQQSLQTQSNAPPSSNRHFWVAFHASARYADLRNSSSLFGVNQPKETHCSWRHKRTRIHSSINLITKDNSFFVPDLLNYHALFYS